MESLCYKSRLGSGRSCSEPLQASHNCSAPRFLVITTLCGHIWPWRRLGSTAWEIYTGENLYFVTEQIKNRLVWDIKLWGTPVIHIPFSMCTEHFTSHNHVFPLTNSWPDLTLTPLAVKFTRISKGPVTYNSGQLKAKTNPFHTDRKEKKRLLSILS